MKQIIFSDDLEKQVATALTESNFKFERPERLDFYLPDYGVYLEIKKYHTARSCNQLASQNNIILIQGVKAVDLFCKLLTMIP